MKQILSLFSALPRGAIYSVFVVALLPALSVAQSQSASIGVRATVEEPLGITELPEEQGHFLVAPALASAFVLLENNGIHFSTTLQADKVGYIRFDFSDATASIGQLPYSLVDSATDSNPLTSRKSQREAPLLTVILTEN